MLYIFDHPLQWHAGSAIFGSKALDLAEHEAEDPKLYHTDVREGVEGKGDRICDKSILLSISIRRLFQKASLLANVDVSGFWTVQLDKWKGSLSVIICYVRNRQRFTCSDSATFKLLMLEIAGKLKFAILPKHIANKAILLFHTKMSSVCCTTLANRPAGGNKNRPEVRFLIARMW